MTSDLIALLGRERVENERLTALVKFLQRQCNESFEQARLANAQVDKFRDAVETQQMENVNLNAWIELQKRDYEKLKTLYVGVVQHAETLRIEVKKSEAVYSAQNELELLRTIRRSQGEGILKLRQSLTEACQERDAASHRANAWREDYNRVEQERNAARAECASASRRTNAWREAYNRVVFRIKKARTLFIQLRKERDVAREGLGQARSAVQALYQETDRLRKDLKVSQAVNHIVARREANNPRLEMILEESYRNEFKRNIDNQKATDAPNCQSS